jgi:MOSC domain-containing protein YiiM
MKGVVVSIHVAEREGAAVRAVPEARLHRDRGIEGDRNCAAPGTIARAGRALTLVESEAVESFAREHAIAFAPADTRRNVVTRGVRLNDLVGRTFRVGPVLVRGTELCEPCSYLAKKTGAPVLPGLVGRGGLKADVLEDGTIRPGDPVGEAVDAGARAAHTA